ncbi:N-acetylglucosamine-6-phosphate deacetylase [Sulfitobacter aestuariivivens]|uniref:N-acetylglucosamine-6-phosphate deacetylase n=1 Tax=Sulfitobacter aestuariivivens TaxID=2766981 RepID=A0A927D4E7_9RHOB|nr:N-acetylglucosamine-6-phosphate deacetylase [Sulfitobacter aestuariivivens]MBD3663212.1 N-acetylglucosamine-6-phosphate deacetylase [Sulfitobacter aestuariivivens]
MTPRTAVIGAQIFDGRKLHDGAALIVAPDGTADVVKAADVPTDLHVVILKGGFICPGFVDLQVNGGGGVMFNDAPRVDTLARMAEAHQTLGTHAMLPTLITDTPTQTRAAIDAVIQAMAQGVPGIVGLHLEGPHLAVAKKGAHDGALIRPMDEADLAMLLAASEHLENLVVTLAPEAVSVQQISALAKAGVIVSIGHSNAGYDVAMRAFDAGATMATHLFNAMSQITARDPGVAGAALRHGNVSVGLIADGLHVHPAVMRMALSAKDAGVFAVTDAMAPAGTGMSTFPLGGRTVTRSEGRLTLDDGTLAGADVDFPRAINVLLRDVEVRTAHALAMTTSTPASILRGADRLGRFQGRVAGLIHFDPEGGTARDLTDLN